MALLHVVRGGYYFTLTWCAKSIFPVAFYANGSYTKCEDVDFTPGSELAGVAQQKVKTGCRLMERREGNL